MGQQVESKHFGAEFCTGMLSQSHSHVFSLIPFQQT